MTHHTIHSETDELIEVSREEYETFRRYWMKEQLRKQQQMTEEELNELYFVDF